MDKLAQEQDREVRGRLHAIIDRLPSASLKRIAEKIEPAAALFLRKETAWKN